MPLYLSRKLGQGVRIGEDCIVMISRDHRNGDRIILIITAPKDVPIVKIDANSHDGEVVNMYGA